MAISLPLKFTGAPKVFHYPGTGLVSFIAHLPSLQIPPLPFQLTS